MDHSRRPHKRIGRNKRGYATLIATIFMVLVVLFLYFNVFTYYQERNAQFQDITIQSQQLDTDRNAEKVTITNASCIQVNGSSYQLEINCNMNNIGPIPVEIVRVWINGTDNTGLSLLLQPSDSLPFVTPLGIPYATKDDTYVLWFVTARGNIISGIINNPQNITGSQGPPGPEGPAGAQGPQGPPGNSGNTSEVIITQTLTKAIGDFIPDYHSFQWAPIDQRTYKVGDWFNGWQVDSRQGNYFVFKIDLIYFGSTPITIAQNTNMLITNFPGTDFASETEYPMLYIANYDSGGFMRAYSTNPISIVPQDGGTRVTIYFAISSLAPRGGPNGTPQGFEVEDIEPQATLTLTIYGMPPSNYAQSFPLFAVESLPFTSISLNPTTGRVGTAVTLTGSNFNANSPVSLSCDGTNFGPSITTNGMGAIPTGTVFNVPPSTFGGHTINASDLSGNSASATFTISPAITLSQSSGPPGSVVMVTGQGFAGSSLLTIRFAGSPIATVPSVSQTDIFGSFSCTFQVPSSSGSKEVRASDASGHSATSSFNVLVRSLTLSPTSGPNGSLVRVSGANFAPNSQIAVYFDQKVQTTNPTTVTSSVSGSFSATLAVPNTSVGNHVVVATDNTAGSATATFYVVGSSITLSPSNGVVGSTITVYGSNFLPNLPITLNFDSSALITNPPNITSNSGGSFSATFVVPNATAGVTHTIIASDNSNVAFAYVSVPIPSILLNPTNGIVGISVTISGSNFLPYSAITLSFDSSPLTSSPLNIISTPAGSFIAIFVVPVSGVGSRSIVATDRIGNLANTNFAINPPPSTPPP